MVKELYEEGMTDVGQLSIELDLSEETVTQIINTLKIRGDIKL
jgi:DNA-binding Lrp family transcriptional regulator